MNPTVPNSDIQNGRTRSDELVSSSGREVCAEARKEEELCWAAEKINQELEKQRKAVVKIEFTSQTISFKGI